VTQPLATNSTSSCCRRRRTTPETKLLPITCATSPGSRPETLAAARLPDPLHGRDTGADGGPWCSCGRPGKDGASRPRPLLGSQLTGQRH
jgi:hypothetical protein